MPSTEPVTWAGAVTTLIEAGLVMLIGMGVLDISDDQLHQIMAFVIAVLGVVGPLLWARSQVTPLAKPQVVIDGKEIDLIRADTHMPPPQAMGR
jgi:hypothetical protein